jgi:hypothetical protein
MQWDVAEIMGSASLGKIEAQEPHFMRFPELPLELRLIIWSFALPEPQVVTIKKKVEQVEEDAQQQASTTFRAEASYNIPALLHVCQDSRSVARKNYRLSFKQHLEHPVYIDFSQDTVYFVNCDALEAFLGQPWKPLTPVGFYEKKYIQFLVVGGPMRGGIEKKIARFEGLQSVIFTSHSWTLNFDSAGNLFENTIKQVLPTEWTKYNTKKNEMRKEKKLGDYKENLDLKLPRLRFLPEEVLHSMMERITYRTLCMLHTHIRGRMGFN